MKEQKKESEVQVSNSWGIASLVVGIIGIVLFLAPYIGLPLSICAIVFAHKQKKIESTGQATAGNVLGIIGTVINGIMLFIMLIALLFVGSMMSFM